MLIYKCFNLYKYFLKGFLKSCVEGGIDKYVKSCIKVYYIYSSCR